MTVWELTAIIVWKSLWWILPCIGGVAVMAYMERD